MRQNKLFALLELIGGSLATAMVVIGYFWFSAPLYTALIELDAMAGNAESEIETVEKVLTDIDLVAASFQKALPSHSKSLDGVSESIAAVSNSIAAWEDEIPGFQSTAADAARFCDTFASHLPIRVPTINLEMKPVRFELPKVIPKTQTVDIPYPTATVETKSKSLSYPNVAKIEMKGYHRNFGKVAGKSLGSISLDYPSGISISNSSVEIEYPSAISIGTKNKSVNIPATPEIRMEDYSFNAPNKVEVTYRDLMSDEKVLLEKSSMRLSSVNESLGVTRNSLGNLKGLMEKEIAESLNETKKSLGEANAALTTFRSDRIPSVLRDLREQRHGINTSRRVFTTLSGIIPLTFCISVLLTGAIAMNGVAKLLVERDTK